MRPRPLRLEQLEVRHMLTTGPLITEFLASNSTDLLDLDGDSSDWLEITNPSTAAVDLNGWYLTDDDAALTKWQIPAVTLPAGASMVVFASSKNLTDPAVELHTNFKLGAGGEYLALVEPDGTTVASEFAPSYPPQTTDISFGYVPVSTDVITSGASSTTFVPLDGSLGQAWTAAGFDDSSWTSGTTGVGFNTNGSYASLLGTDIDNVMRGNASSAYVRVPFGISDLSTVDALLLRMQFDDGFVAYINGMEVASSNAPASPAWDSTATQSQPDGDPEVFQFDVSAALSVLQQGNNLLAIHGLNSSSNSTDFLVAPELAALQINVGPPAFLQVTTPGTLNLASALGQVAEPQFSHQRGFYDSTFDLTITSETADATIRYTTDGSEPTADTGLIYSGPISIGTTSVIRALAFKPDLPATRVSTHTYLFLDDILQQPENVAGYPNNTYSVGVGTARHDYEMDPAIVNNPAYSQAIRDGLLGIPSLAISSPVDDIFGSFSFYDGNDEKPVSIEVIDPTGATFNHQIDGGIEPHSHNRLKRSLRLSFKEQYGPTQWVTNLLQNAPLSGNSASDGIDQIVLRGGNNRAWSRSWNPDATTFTEDQWFRDSQIALSGFGSHGTFVHLYINGLYWGLYNPVERPGEKFQADYFGGDDADYYSRNHDGRERGDSTRWDYLKGPLIDKDLSDPVNYAELQEYLDTDSFTDYLLLNWYQATTDWPQNNYYLGNRNDVPGPVRYFAWDGEWSWDRGNGFSTDGAWVHPAFRDGSNNTTDMARIWRAVAESDEFMIAFADRAYKHLANDGALTDGESLARWNTLNDHVRDAVVAESARWGDSLAGLGEPTRTRDVDWQNEVDNIASMMMGNADRLIAALRDEGYFPSIDAATFSQRGGTVPSGFSLSLSTGAGDIYYTLDDSDPRLPGGGVAPSAMLYNSSAGIPITANATVRVRVLSGGEWSALDEAAFVVDGMVGNTAPTVDAGTNQNITLPASANLSGTASDDGLPTIGTLTTTWSQLTGPGTTTFGDASQLSTTASFSVDGVYVLRLTATDGALTSTSDVTITVAPEGPSNTAPTVDAGTNQNITLPASANLSGTASDDGLPTSGTLTTTWSQLTGPGTTTFGDASQLSTTASFSVDGVYVLRLTAADGELTSTSDVTITVAPEVTTLSVTSFTLINADTDLPAVGFESLTDGAVLDINALPTLNLNVEALTGGDPGSVAFALDGDSDFRTESIAPYALFGDGVGGFNAGMFDIGQHTITATPFTGSAGNGTAGQSLTVNFTVVDGLPPIPGDYDGNQVVDENDHAVWVASLGSTTNLAADGNGDLVVDISDYAIWRDNLGATQPAALATSTNITLVGLVEAEASPQGSKHLSASSASALSSEFHSRNLLLLTPQSNQTPAASLDEAFATFDDTEDATDKEELPSELLD